MRLSHKEAGKTGKVPGTLHKKHTSGLVVHPKMGRGVGNLLVIFQNPCMMIQDNNWNRFQNRCIRTMGKEDCGVTIKDIARLAGVGVATVSRVLNHHPDVSPATRKKVMEVVEEQGFEPNCNAKHLKQQVGTTIAILVKGTQNMLFADLVERVQRKLREAGRETSVYHLDEEDNEVDFALRLCRERKPPGILFLGGDREFFARGFAPIQIPAVLLTSSAEGVPFRNLSSLTTDDAEGGRLAVEYLLKQGHREIGFVGGHNSPTQVGYQRLLGARDALAAWNLASDRRELWEPCRYSMADGCAAARRLLKRCKNVTAVFAMSDVIAVGVMRAAYEMGKRVPEDLSVVGYDGTPMADYLVPKLTTVRQDPEYLAQEGVKLLLHAMEDGLTRPVHAIAPPQLKPGESVAPPKPGC